MSTMSSDSDLDGGGSLPLPEIFDHNPTRMERNEVSFSLSCYHYLQEAPCRLSWSLENRLLHD